MDSWTIWLVCAFYQVLWDCRECRQDNGDFTVVGLCKDYLTLGPELSRLQWRVELAKLNTDNTIGSHSNSNLWN